MLLILTGNIVNRKLTRSLQLQGLIVSESIEKTWQGSNFSDFFK